MIEDDDVFQIGNKDIIPFQYTFFIESIETLIDFFPLDCQLLSEKLHVIIHHFQPFFIDGKFYVENNIFPVIIFSFHIIITICIDHFYDASIMLQSHMFIGSRQLYW